MRAAPLFTLVAVLFAGTAAHVQAATTPAPDASQLVEIKGQLDSLKVRTDAFDDNRAVKIVIAPVHVGYPKLRRDPQPYYRDIDFQLNQRDTEQLQKTIADTFKASWFAKRNWQLVTDPAAADVRLVIDIREFWLAAPLNESIHVHKTYTEESARFTLTGHIERISDQQHLVEFSDKRKVRQIGMMPGRFERFTAMTFWRDMRRELGLAAGQLNRLVPSGKNGHNS